MNAAIFDCSAVPVRATRFCQIPPKWVLQPAEQSSFFAPMYAKIFQQIYDSSIADDWQVRIVFEDLLVLANQEGIVDMTPEAIAARTRIPSEIVNRALTVLQRPDPKSRTPEHNGRRIVLLDPTHRSWGWQIVNYEKYRSIKSEFDRRSYMRKYMRNKRQEVCKTESLTESNKNLTSPSASVCTSVQKEGGVGETNLVEWLRRAIGKLYNRPESPGVVGDYDEETLLAAISRRPNLKSEFATISEYQSTITEKKFFPHSAISLLHKWQATLDKARNHHTIIPKDRASIESQKRLERDRKASEMERTRISEIEGPM